MKNMLILSHNIDDYLLGGSKFITELYPNDTDSKLMRVLRKISLATSLGVKSVLNEWYEECEKYDTIILFDTGNADYLIRLIHKKAPKARLILWYWNPIEKTISIDKINRQYCEIWSYHKGDCEKYNLNYNTQFFIPDNKTLNAENIEENGPIYQDVYFVGADKNRSQLLHEIEVVLIKNNISYKFVLTKFKKNSKKTNIPYSKPISAEESAVNVECSKAVIDIVEETQAGGFTLRPLEAAQHKKKLITNNKKIMDIKFYNPNNIFVWGVDSVEGLKKFIDSPYDESTDSETKFYSIDSWLKRFNHLSS